MNGSSWINMFDSDWSARPTEPRWGWGSMMHVLMIRFPDPTPETRGWWRRSFGWVKPINLPILVG